MEKATIRRPVHGHGKISVGTFATQCYLPIDMCSITQNTTLVRRCATYVSLADHVLTKYLDRDRVDIKSQTHTNSSDRENKIGKVEIKVSLQNITF